MIKRKAGFKKLGSYELDDDDAGHWVEDDYYDDDWAVRVNRFADPGGESALYAADDSNPRNLPCPTCHWPNRITPADKARGYQCDACANANERGYDIDYYEGDDDSDD